MKEQIKARSARLFRKWPNMLLNLQFVCSSILQDMEITTAENYSSLYQQVHDYLRAEALAGKILSFRGRYGGLTNNSIFRFRNTLCVLGEKEKQEKRAQCYRNTIRAIASY